MFRRRASSSGRDWGAWAAGGRGGGGGGGGGGGFAVVAEPYTFGRFGSTPAEYYEKSVEPSYLYLENRFMQFAHARCPAEEPEMTGHTGRKVLPTNAAWPDGFTEVFDFSYADSPAARPREFDQTNRGGGDQPHFNYPLRNVPEDAYKVVHTRGGPAGLTKTIAELTVQQAIREAFPGAVYLHMGEGWRVRDWTSTSFDRTIRVNPTKSPIPPKPIIRKFVNFGLDRDGIGAGRFRKGERGFLAECHLQVNERVEGYHRGGKKKLYKDLRQKKPGMTPKTRDFRTTGVVMHIDEDCFRVKGVKQRTADRLRNLMLREYSISGQDIDAVATRISMIRAGQRQSVSYVLVLFDSTQGTLRLTEPAYSNPDDLLTMLERSISMTTPDDDPVTPEEVAALRSWFEHLGDEDGGLPPVVDGPAEGVVWVQVYDVDSIVAYRDRQGMLRDIKVLGHEFIDRHLFYHYKTDKQGKAMASAEFIEHVGDEWRIVYLNRGTKEKREDPDDEPED